METDIMKYFITQGPFAVLFIWMFISNQKRERQAMEDSKAREKELNNIIQRQNNVLSKFSEKYDLIISELRELKERLR